MDEYKMTIGAREYTLHEQIGEGGFAKVYRGIDNESGERVAVKRFHKTYKSFDTEVQALQSLRHPNIVRLLYSGLGRMGMDEEHYIVMEYVAGENLREYSREANRRIIIGLVMQIAVAVGYAHGRGILHRDLKPENVLVSEQGEVCVLDFGIAKMATAGETHWSRSTRQGASGTPTYMAPEQHNESPELREGCDIWALGVMLYELLEGELPFSGGVVYELATQICENETPPLARTEDGELEQIVHRALQKKPEERYASTAELNEALSQYLRNCAGKELQWHQLDESRWRQLRASLEQCQRLQVPVVAPQMLVIGAAAQPLEVWLGFAAGKKTVALKRLKGRLAAGHLVHLGDAIVAALARAAEVGLAADIPKREQIRYEQSTRQWQILGYDWPYAAHSPRSGAHKLMQLLRYGAKQELQYLLEQEEQQTARDWWQETRKELVALRQLPQLEQCEEYLQKGPEHEAIAAVREVIAALWSDSSILAKRASRILALAMAGRDEAAQAVVEVVFAPPPDDRQLLGKWQQRHPDGEERTVYVLRNARQIAVAQVAISGFIFLRQGSYSCGGASHMVEEYLHDETGMEFALLPGGEFMMGSPESDEMAYDNEKPQYRVTVQPFLMARYPTTQEQWRRIVEKYPDELKDVEAEPSFHEGAKRPVENVSWLDCYKFAKKTGLYLPSEAQWEYACRAGTTTRYYWGDAVDGAYLWYDENAGYETHPVGEKKPNAFGLCDMSGNVLEWCLDEWHENYSGAPTNGSVWGELNLQPASLRVDRGGCFADDPRDCRSACRDRNLAGFRWYYQGVRFSRPPRP